MTSATRWCGWRARSIGTFSIGVFPARARRAATAADAADSRAVAPEAQAQPVGRGAVRAGWRTPLPILLRRIELLPPAAVRPFLVDALAAAAGRGTAFGADPGKPGGGAQDRGAGEEGPRTGGGRYDGAAQGDRASDRCPAVPSGLGEAGRSGAARGRADAPELSPPGQTRGADGRALPPTRTTSSGRGARANSCAPDWAG